MEKQRSSISTQSYLVFTAIVLTAIVIFARVLYLFLVPGSDLRAMADKNAYRSREVTGIRGNILSTDGELIATSVPVFSLHWDYKVIQDSLPAPYYDTLSSGLASVLPKTKGHFLKLLKKARATNNRYLKLYHEASYEQLIKLKQQPLFCRGRYKSGLIAEAFYRREYPYQELALRTIGRHKEQAKENSVGIEGAYDHFLSGEKISRLEKRISGGMYRPIEFNDNVEPHNGYDIITTLNMKYQDVAENALRRHLTEHKATEGCAVLMEVHTGHILAIANLSTRTGRENQLSSTFDESYNVALGGAMEPGSTFKLATALALLDDEKADTNDTVIITNGVKYYHRQKMIDSHIEKGKFTFTLKTAFKESSNAAISWFAYKHYKSHPEAFIKKLKQFNLTEKQGVEIAGEPTPLIKDTEDPQWSGVSLPWMSIGYELMLTPLQVLGFYNAVANDGTYVKPLLVKQIREGDRIIEEYGTEVLKNRIAGKEALSKAQELLKEVVRDGTAERAFINNPYPVAGKTGTAQIYTARGYSKKEYNASFVGYFPADNPKYSCIVTVNHPKAGRYYASSVAVPVFKEIANKVYASDLSIHEDLTDTVARYSTWAYGYTDDLREILSTMHYPTMVDSCTWTSLTLKSKEEIITQRSQPQQGIVPNLLGLGLRDAVYMAENTGMRVQATGEGKVKKQTPKAGTKIDPSQTISIILR